MSRFNKLTIKSIITEFQKETSNGDFLMQPILFDTHWITLFELDEIKLNKILTATKDKI